MGNQDDLSVHLGGQIYTGKWTYVPQGGSMMLMSGIASGGGGSAFGTGTGMMLPAGGGGLATLTGTDGSSPSCQFQYSEWSRTGIGVCQQSDGKVYDLHIR
jgi:hypothetical protein